MHNTYLFYPQYQEGKEPFVTQWLPYSVSTVWAYVDQFKEIKEYLSDVGYTDLIIKNIIKFNENFNVNRSSKEAYIVDYYFNLYEFIFYNNVVLNKKKTSYVYSNNINWNSDDEFDHLVYIRQRQGFLTKNIIQKQE
jgi:hypothetical protein